MNASRLIELGAHDHRMHATSQAGCSAWSLQAYSAHSLAASANGMQFGGWWSQLADGRTFEPSHSALPNHQVTMMHSQTATAQALIPYLTRGM